MGEEGKGKQKGTGKGEAATVEDSREKNWEEKAEMDLKKYFYFLKIK